MHDVMAACQELRYEDLEIYRSGDAQIIVAPTAPAPAVAELAAATLENTDLAVASTDEEIFAALRWASSLNTDTCVLHLIRSLPKEVLEEQVAFYRRHKEDAVAVAAKTQGPQAKIALGPNARYYTRMMVARRFHIYCRTHNILTDKRLPHGATKAFIRDNIAY